MIKIKFLTIGKIASSIPFINTEETYNIYTEKDILKIADTSFFENVDFIFLVADIQDEFVSKHILETIMFLKNHEVPFITVLPSAKHTLSSVLNQITEVSSVIVIEDQQNNDLDQFVKSLFTMVHTEKIDEYRMLDDFFSSTIMLQSIFKAKCIFYLFSNITETYLEKAKRKKLEFWKLLEKANTVWIDFPSQKKHDVFNEKAFSFFWENIDEDADLYTTYNQSAQEDCFNLLISISKSKFDRVFQKDVNMKIALVTSKEFVDYELLKLRLDELEVNEIICGSSESYPLAQKYQSERENVIVSKAEGKLAQRAYNAIDLAEKVVVFSNGTGKPDKSRTNLAIKKAMQNEKTVYVYPYKADAFDLSQEDEYIKIDFKNSVKQAFHSNGIYLNRDEVKELIQNLQKIEKALSVQ